MSKVRLAAFLVGNTQVGIHIDQVAHAMTIPTTWTTLPRRDSALCGVVEYNGNVIPVVDLARWLPITGPENTDTSSHRIVVLCSMGKIVGLRANLVMGIVEEEARNIQQLCHVDDADNVFSSAINVKELGSVLSLLDVAKLLALTSIWCAADNIEQGITSIVVQNEDNTVSSANCAIFDIEGLEIGIRAKSVAEVIPMPTLKEFHSADFIGLCEWRNRIVPILSPSALSGSSSKTTTSNLLSIIECNGSFLGIPIGAASRFEFLAINSGVISSRFGKTVFSENSNPIQVIDTEALFSAYPEAGLSVDATDNTGKLASVNLEAYFIFETDGLFATKISEVEEIINIPASYAECPEANAVQWRNKSIRLQDLRIRKEGSACAMIVKHADFHVGYVLSKVHAMIPKDTATITKLKLGSSEPFEVITTGVGSNQESYKIVSIEKLFVYSNTII